MNAMTRATPRRSFTLLELVVVMAILAVLLALVMEGYAGLMQSTAVATGAAMLNDALTQGRADAVAQNTTVEVRFYDVPPQAGAPPAYDALQLHWLKPDGTTPAVAVALLLPSWVVIDTTATYSPLIASNPQMATPDATDSRLNNQTRVFHFLPDGSTDLNPGDELVPDGACGEPVRPGAFSLELGVRRGRCRRPGGRRFTGLKGQCAPRPFVTQSSQNNFASALQLAAHDL